MQQSTQEHIAPKPKDCEAERVDFFSPPLVDPIQQADPNYKPKCIKEGHDLVPPLDSSPPFSAEELALAKTFNRLPRTKTMPDGKPSDIYFDVRLLKLEQTVFMPVFMNSVFNPSHSLRLFEYWEPDFVMAGGMPLAERVAVAFISEFADEKKYKETHRQYSESLKPNWRPNSLMCNDIVLAKLVTQALNLLGVKDYEVIPVQRSAIHDTLIMNCFRVWTQLFSPGSTGISPFKVAEHHIRIKDGKVSKTAKKGRDEIPQALRLCASCKKGTVSVQLCGGCKALAYCDKVCQKNDWKAHKKICKELKLPYT